MHVLNGIRKIFIIKVFIIFAFIHAMIVPADMIGPNFISSDELPITLAITGQIYALNQNVTGTITITADDVTLNLNGFIVTGQIIINGKRALIYGGKVIAPSPASNIIADAGIIQLLTGADDAQIINCFIGASDTTAIGVRGSLALVINSDNCAVTNCTIQGGNAAGLNGVAQGGAGLFVFGNRAIIENCQVYGGAGSDSNDGTIGVGAGADGFSIGAVDGVELLSSVFYAGDAGSMSATNDIANVTLNSAGQNDSSGTNLLIRDCKVYGGNSMPIVTTANAGGAAGPVVLANGRAGLALVGASSSTLIYNSDIRGGASSGLSAVNIGTANSVTQSTAGGQGIYCEGSLVIEGSSILGGPARAFVATGTIGDGAIVNFGTGGDGIQIQPSSQRVIITHSGIQGGSASAVSGVNIATVTNVNLAPGGSGITSSSLALLMYDVAIQGGSSNSITASGAIGSVGSGIGTNRGGHALFLGNGTLTAQLEQCILRAGAISPIIATGNINNISVSNGGNGVAIGYTTSSVTPFAQSIFVECNVTGGLGGDITSTAGAVATVTPVTASSAGNGYSLFATQASNVDILEGTITTLRGGTITSFNAPTLATTGGNGGTGISITGPAITGVRVHNVSIVATGNGGDAVFVGGNGGTGIFVAGSVGIIAELSNNIICYTGIGGTGSVAGTGGQAIDVASIASSRMIVYANYAHNIANAIPYNIAAGNVDAFSTGTAYSAAAGTNNLFNLYK